MDPHIAALAPHMCLTIEVLDIREGDPRPQALLDDPDRALDFALRLWRKRLADPGSDPNGGHEIRKERVPPWDFVLHFQHTLLHPAGRAGFGKSTKVPKGSIKQRIIVDASQRLTKTT